MKADMPTTKRGLSGRDRKRIALTSLPLRDGANLDEILVQIGAATQVYWKDSTKEKEPAILVRLIAPTVLRCIEENRVRSRLRRILCSRTYSR